DNFVLFPENKIIEKQLRLAYQKFADLSNTWTTNSNKNISFYKENYSLKNCHLVKNGVDIDVFKSKYAKPDDLVQFDGPIVGFGGKITHLFDYELFNYCVEKNKDKVFIIVGQILDKNVFSHIKFESNVHYLGDKTYSEYPAYVTNFDIGIIPYVTNHLEHGADSIKVYEYLAAGILVVGTAAAGMTDLSEYLYVASNKEDFSHYLNEGLKNITSEENKILPDSHTWAHKAEQIVNILA
ncbi:MAG: glycosyltransferase, partial [Leeuwenhoekiella sp.]